MSQSVMAMMIVPDVAAILPTPGIMDLVEKMKWFDFPLNLYCVASSLLIQLDHDDSFWLLQLIFAFWVKKMSGEKDDDGEIKIDLAVPSCCFKWPQSYVIRR